jgi:serine/threonine protein kinase
MDNLVGQILLDRYHVEGFIGRGGMAEVYRVWDKERAACLAMKVLREDLAEDLVFLRRFRREAQTLARLQHPHIVRFYGLEQDGSLAFMLMDFVEGTNLRRRIFQQHGRGMELETVLTYLQPICSALHYAHQQGMVHCDIKPGNVLIDNAERVFVTDFGIARMMDTATLTMVGLGTPAYMGPELVRGGEPRPQSDIYALGVILYEMLTGGERPFTGSQAHTTGSTTEKVLWEQLYLNPPSPRRYNPDISANLEQVVLTCLSKDAAQRYQTALDVLNALQQSTWRTGVEATLIESEVEPPVWVEERHYAEAQGRGEPDRRTPVQRPRPPTEMRSQRAGLLSTLRRSLQTAKRAWLVVGLLGAAALGVLLFAVLGGPPLSGLLVAEGETLTPTISLSALPLVEPLFGRVEARQSGGASHLLSKGEVLPAGASVKTYDDSAALLTIAGEASVEVHANSELLVDSIEWVDDSPVIDLRQTAGTTYHRVVNTDDAKAPQYRVHTPAGTAVAQDGAFWLIEEPAGWRFLPTEGSITVEVSGGGSEEGQSHLLDSAAAACLLVDGSGHLLACADASKPERLTDGKNLVPTAIATAIIRAAPTSAPISTSTRIPSPTPVDTPTPTSPPPTLPPTPVPTATFTPVPTVTPTPVPPQGECPYGLVAVAESGDTIWCWGTLGTYGTGCGASYAISNDRCAHGSPDCGGHCPGACLENFGPGLTAICQSNGTCACSTSVQR